MPSYLWNAFFSSGLLLQPVLAQEKVSGPTVTLLDPQLGSSDGYGQIGCVRPDHPGGVWPEAAPARPRRTSSATVAVQGVPTDIAYTQP